MKKITIIVLALFLFGCNEENPITIYTGPPLPIVGFRGPATSSTHAEVDSTKARVEGFNEFTLYLGDFSNTEPSVSGNTYTWSLVREGVTYRLTGVMMADSSFSWKLVLNGNQNGGTTYNNWTAFEGTTDAARKNAHWSIYAEHTTVKSSDFIWTVTSLSLIGTLNVYTDGVISGSTVITDNSNNTGEIRIYQGAVLTYRAVWISNGSGQYWYYNENGTIASQGSWS